MDIIYPCCAGFDVHKETVVAAVRDNRHGGRARVTTRTFGATTTALEQLRDWLLACDVTAIAMESTGVYWKPVFNILEGHFEALYLCNAQHMKRVPGRKTDVSDAEWIAQLLQAGLLTASFVPNRTMRDLRDLNRERTQLDHESSRIVNRLQKILEDANIKLGNEVSDITGVSSRAMLETIAAGDYAPVRVAELARGRMRTKVPALTEALRGHVTDHHRFMIRRFLDQYDAVQREIVAFDERIAAVMNAADDTANDGDGPPSAGVPPSASQGPDAPDRSNDEPQQRSGLSYEAAVELLDTIPGISRVSAERILAEIGTDMGRFPSASHLASWAGMSPGSSSSAGKVVKGKRRRKGNKWLGAALNQVAWAAKRTNNTYFASAYRRWAARRGTKRAIMAVGHAILRTIWHVLSRRQAYADLGADWFDKLQPQRTIRGMAKRLRSLGYEIVPAHSHPEATM
jgi:transposase